MKVSIGVTDNEWSNKGAGLDELKADSLKQE
jgi:hypothetical protein